MNVLAEITRLESLDQAALKERWRELYGAEPPAYRRGFLVRGLAHRIQELAFGGLGQDTRRRLVEAAENPDVEPSQRAPGEGMINGTELIREWQGVEHHVVAADGGFEWQGRKYKSLSAVARAITGTRWSGPLFFGLRKHGKAAS